MHLPILSAEQIRQWDLFSATDQKITSIELMERAAAACLQWLETNAYLNRSFTIFCAKGNNGGDGLALARMLAEMECHTTVYILEFGHKGTEDFQANLMLLHQTSVEILFIQHEENIHPIPENNVVIDALFGSGLNRPLEGLTLKLVQHINREGNEVISIDIPSGMYADSSSISNEMITAHHTLSFQACKLAFLMAENAAATGTVHLLEIGLSPRFLNDIIHSFQTISASLINRIYQPRLKHTHKGNYGHAGIIAGSSGMMGAAVLAARSCLRAGVGKLTCFVPKDGLQILQLSVPEAICSLALNDPGVDTHSYDLQQYSALGIGPGIGLQDGETIMKRVLKQAGRLVVDADALNLLSLYPSLLKQLPPYAILTPHPKEWERLSGASANDFERLDKVKEFAMEYKAIVILKGHHSFIAMPDGQTYFNLNGNPGMATAGSGDVLTGLITGLISQQYSPQEAALMGVYLHGMAGDLAAEINSEEGMVASDIINGLPIAFKKLAAYHDSL